MVQFAQLTENCQTAPVTPSASSLCWFWKTEQLLPEEQFMGSLCQHVSSSETGKSRNVCMCVCVCYLIISDSLRLATQKFFVSALNQNVWAKNSCWALTNSTFLSVAAVTVIFNGKLLNPAQRFTTSVVPKLWAVAHKGAVTVLRVSRESLSRLGINKKLSLKSLTSTNSHIFTPKLIKQDHRLWRSSSSIISQMWPWWEKQWKSLFNQDNYKTSIRYILFKLLFWLGFKYWHEDTSLSFLWDILHWIYNQSVISCCYPPLTLTFIHSDTYWIPSFLFTDVQFWKLKITIIKILSILTNQNCDN